MTRTRQLLMTSPIAIAIVGVISMLAITYTPDVRHASAAVEFDDVLILDEDFIDDVSEGSVLDICGSPMRNGAENACVHDDLANPQITLQNNATLPIDERTATSAAAANGYIRRDGDDWELTPGGVKTVSRRVAEEAYHAARTQAGKNVTLPISWLAAGTGLLVCVLLVNRSRRKRGGGR